jgi:hypothetical protein
MTDSKQTGNPIFDIWLSNQKQFLDAQSQWTKPASKVENPFINAGFVDQSMKSWQQCEEQYKNWMKVAENWTSDSANKDAESDAPADEDYSAQALNHMLNPTTFMQSGFEMMDQVFRKLVNGPEFADIGMLEKKMMKSGQDWQSFQDASHHYQEVISLAWLRAYQHFSDEFMDQLQAENIGSEETLKRWLSIADEEMVKTLRSDEFLAAQRQLFSTGTAYKLKYREFAEMWCENHTIPTRSEVDDLHKVIYELRREVRTLKRRVDKQEAAAAPAKPAPKKVAAKKKAPAKKEKK